MSLGVVHAALAPQVAEAHSSMSVHVVSAPEASAFAAWVVPEAQSTHALLETYWLMAHWVAVHVVSPPEASVSAAWVVPAAQSAHALLETYWLMAHKVAVHVAAPSVTAEPLYPASHEQRKPLALGVVHAALSPQVAQCCRTCAFYSAWGKCASGLRISDW